MRGIVLVLAAGCFITLHGPNGKDEMHVDAASIFIVRAVTPGIEHHIAPGTKTILYVNGHKFGVSETVEQVEDMIEQQCEEK
jgi:uncharacterized protein YlzI (FlbEa/FlbD family)